MIKIPCLFRREFGEVPRLLDEITPGCEWVIYGEGVATRKFDGTACAVIQGRLFARYDAKCDPATGLPRRPIPSPAVPCTDAPDPVTGHWPHWLAVFDQPQYKWHRAAWQECRQMCDGTYELCGPHFQTNPEGLPWDVFIQHGDIRYEDAPRTMTALCEWLAPRDIEGLVWHHPDGRMAKLRKADFGLPRKPAAGELP